MFCCLFLSLLHQAPPFLAAPRHACLVPPRHFAYRHAMSRLPCLCAACHATLRRACHVSPVQSWSRLVVSCLPCPVSPVRAMPRIVSPALPCLATNGHAPRCPPFPSVPLADLPCRAPPGLHRPAFPCHVGTRLPCVSSRASTRPPSSACLAFSSITPPGLVTPAETCRAA